MKLQPYDTSYTHGVAMQRHCKVEAARLSTNVYDRFRLDKTKAEARILDIQPGAWNEEIVCNMRVVSLDNPPPYNALSYVWGEYIPRFVVRIQGQMVLASANLHAALRRIREHGSGAVVSIFADALCIGKCHCMD